MELMGDLEHSTPSPGADVHKGHSETGTGTDDDGSEATNEREAGDHAAPSGRRPYEDELKLGDCDSYGKEQRIFPSQMAGSAGGAYEGHPMKVFAHSSMHPNSATAARYGQSGPFECHVNDGGCSPFAFLEEGDTQHKRKISEVLDGHSEGSYQISAHHQGNPEANYTSRNVVISQLLANCSRQLATTHVGPSVCII